MLQTNRLRWGIGLLLTLAVCLQGVAQSAPCTNQSPRRLTGNIPPGNSSITQGSEGTLYYQGVRLKQCGQHYHCAIENFQGCPGQVPTERPVTTCGPLAPGSWVEIHTVFSAEVVTDRPCDPETLDCCKTGPFVVMGYHARVDASPIASPVPTRFGLPAFQWLGSNTGPDKVPDECKPITAEWNFTRGCDFIVTQGQLGVFRHADGARQLQPPDRLSNTLILVPAGHDAHHGEE